ncbi:unnamed protein product, partial [Prorocentrum cordatum]
SPCRLGPAAAPARGAPRRLGALRRGAGGRPPPGPAGGGGEGGAAEWDGSSGEPRERPWRCRWAPSSAPHSASRGRTMVLPRRHRVQVLVVPAVPRVRRSITDALGLAPRTRCWARWTTWCCGRGARSRASRPPPRPRTTRPRPSGRRRRPMRPPAGSSRWPRAAAPCASPRTAR